MESHTEPFFLSSSTPQSHPELPLYGSVCSSSSLLIAGLFIMQLSRSFPLTVAGSLVLLNEAATCVWVWTRAFISLLSACGMAASYGRCMVSSF